MLIVNAGELLRFIGVSGCLLAALALAVLHCLSGADRSGDGRSRASFVARPTRRVGVAFVAVAALAWSGYAGSVMGGWRGSAVPRVGHHAPALPLLAEVRLGPVA